MDFIENSRYEELAKKFLERKERKNYYEVIALNHAHLEEIRFLQEFNDEEIKALRELRDKYGQEDFVKHLDEVFSDPDDIYDFSCGCPIVDIHLDKAYHTYTFIRHELSGGSLQWYIALVELTDECYIRLLSLCIKDKGMNVNKLRYADKKLYNIVIREVDNYLCEDDYYGGTHPYLITMNEIKDDAAQILAENPELAHSGMIFYPFE